MRRADVRELLQDVGVGLQACRWTLIFRQEGDAVVDHVISEDPTVGILCRLRWIEAKHVGKCALVVNRRNRFLTRVVARMPHQMHELVKPSLAVVDGLARVVVLLGVIGVEEAANARMSRAIDVKQLSVASYAAPSPDVNLGLGTKFTRRQLDHSRKHVRFRIRIHAGPWRLAADMGLREVSFAAGIEEVLDSVEVEKERVAAASGKKSVGARLDHIRFGSEGDFGVSDYLPPYRFVRARLQARRHEYVNGLPPILRLREHIAERDVREVIGVVINVEAIDCVGMKCVRIWISIEDDHGSVLVGGRLERVQVAKVEPLIAERRAEAESSEMV